MHKFARNTLFPLFLILACPVTAFLLWYTVAVLDGSIAALIKFLINQGFFQFLWDVWFPLFFGTKEAWTLILTFMAFQLILMRIIPGKSVEGPVTPKGNVPVYKVNGLACYLITLFLYCLCSFKLHWFSPNIIYINFPGILGALNVFSLLFCLILYFKGRFKPSTSDSGSSGHFIFDYYWGTELYPRILGWDVKMFTNCRMGMIGWPVILISLAAEQIDVFGTLSNSMCVALLIQLVYITKFFIWESGYLRSLDIMHDRAGFYICWGCLMWVPSFYTLPTFYLVNHPIALNGILAFFIALAGVSCVLMNYFADAQRQKVRATNGNCRIWGKSPDIIIATYSTEDGQNKESILLTSGWWGLSRHFHYVPEILGAFFWTLPALFHHVLPYFYVIFLTVLLMHRSIRDEERCQKKYGKYWDEYRRRVPGRILPRFRIKDESVRRYPSMG